LQKRTEQVKQAMERGEQESHPSPPRKDRNWPGRPWTERVTGPLRFSRTTDTDGEGRPSIIYKFELPPGETDLPQAVYDILNDMKQLQRGERWGGGQHSSGLKFKRDKKHGRVWVLPNDGTGRTAADILDIRLLELAARLEADLSHGR
jgi:hypothetical protein